MKRALRFLHFAWLCIAVVVLGSFCASAFGGDVDFGGGGDSDYFHSDNTENIQDIFSSGAAKAIAVVCGGAIVMVLLFSHNNVVKEVDQDSINELREIDPQFDQKMIESMVADWVHNFEAAWCKQDMAPYREQIVADLFHSYEDQLNGMKQMGHIPVTEDLEVIECCLERWEKTPDGQENLYIWIDEKKRTYIIDERLDRVIEGSIHTIYHLLYRWQLSREDKEHHWQLKHVTKLKQMNE